MSENNNPNTNPIESTSERKVTQVEAILQQISKEVNYLQILENTFTHITKDSPNFTPSQFNNQKMKAAFLAFQEVGETVSLDDKKKYINSINQELNLWRKQIVELEKNVTLQVLRTFVETSNPPVHHQILIALARFYFVFKESVEKRQKFECLTMFLFADEAENQKRQLIQEKAEVKKTYQEIFLNWSKKPDIVLEDNIKKLIFDELDNFVAEIEKAKNLNQLKEENILSKYQQFKVNLNKNYFQSDVLPEIVEKNIKIGNLINNKISKEMTANLEEIQFQSHTDFEKQYAEVLGKSVTISKIIPFKEPKVANLETVNINTEKPSKPKVEKFSATKSKKSPNKWLIAACLSAVILTIVFNFSYLTNAIQKPAVEEGEVVNKDGLPNGNFLAEARIKDQVLRVVVKSDWDSLSPHDKKETA
nr:hypothetical protein [Pyrinomonadaceae bacterium]